MFAASGHNNYAKSARLYLQLMSDLPNTHEWLYDQLTSGFHAVRRTDRYWTGLSTDLVIDIDAIEKVQRRFTKSFPNLCDLPYPSRIACLNIIPLGERHSNIDLITSYRILNNLVHHNLTRGHSLILSKPKVRLNVSKFSFYSRVVDPWNLLPDRVVSAGTLPTFKFLLKTLHL